MKNDFFSHQSVSQRLSKKLRDWYGVSVVVNHLSDSSNIEVNNLKFEVSRCKQFDNTSGKFSIIHNDKLIEFTKMYDLVKESKRC